MAYQVKTTKNYGQRLLGSLKGAGKGFAIFGIGTILLFANEGNFVKTKKTIGEAEKALVRVSDVSAVDAALNGKLIHASAIADTQEELFDPEFGISERAIAISRMVEYYQYEEKSKTETKDKMGGGEETTTTYTYEKKWVSRPVSSAGFADPDYRSANSVLVEVEAKTVYAENVSFGAYRLPRFIAASINGGVPAEVKMSAEEFAQKGPAAQVQGNVVYFGASPASPQIGDVRVTLTQAPPAEISIIARVVGSTFEPYSGGRAFASVAMGAVSADAMFESARKSNSAATWLLRLIGVILIVAALKAVFNILPSLFKVVPILGKIMGAGVGLVCAIGGGAWSLVIIGIAWLFYRPLIGIPMLLAAAAGIWFLSKKGKEKASPA